MSKYRIIKLKADKIIRFGKMQKRAGGEDEASYRVDLDKKFMYEEIVEEQLLMGSCALFDQFQLMQGKAVRTLEQGGSISEELLQKLVIVDFTDIYRKGADISEDSVEALITNGFFMKYGEKEMLMLPFDKSGNMSRKCRLSFINAEYLERMNERLNLGIDFRKIKVQLSKYYAYRGLYLSTARRIEEVALTPETLLVINDIPNQESYMKDVFVEQGEMDKQDKSKVSFETRKVERETIKIPFDGQGIISPVYADKLNKMVDAEQEINSFQIRLPFVKGMLHRVDFHAFLEEFDENYKADTYMMKDAFGVERDLKRAHIIMTKSMFKCFGWIQKECGDKTDPMKFYCDALEKYRHALYVSATDLPYGKARVTHLSYQFLNTLKLSEEQFQSLTDKHLEYIKHPIRYIEETRGQCVEDDEEKGAYYDFPNWQKALLRNPYFGHLPYIRTQLENIQTALMTKLALGKLVVKGQTRYLTRDLPYMMVNLIQDEQKRTALRNLKIFYYRFFLPQGVQGNNEMELDYSTYCGFFRSPHLSRNEQGLLAPVMKKDGFSEKYQMVWKILLRYFGHLTGIVMFGNESLEPMALGGADFDGDLVSMITDSDVVEAIKAGVYTENKENSLDIDRKASVPYIKIPAVPAQEEAVPKFIPYLQIKDTFSNRIGLISNAAIAIGQWEYGNQKSGNQEEEYGNQKSVSKKEEKADVNLKCSHCTILTGLEIDAAKNGVHPDLSMLTENERLKTCGYLRFKKKFEELKRNKAYHFNRLKAEKKLAKQTKKQTEKKPEKYVLKLGGEKVLEYTEEEGTYINRLPVVFMENLEIKPDIPNGKNKEYFHFPKRSREEQQKELEQEELFEKRCNAIFDSYEYYKKFLKHIQEKTADKRLGERNLKKLLKKQYDTEYLRKIYEEDLPWLFEKLIEKTGGYSALKELQNKINKKKWHLMCKADKKKFLSEEILKGEAVDGEAWEIVLQPYNHGYKILWYMIQSLIDVLKPKSGYEELKSGFETKEKRRSTVSGQTEKEAEYLLKNHVQNKESGIAAKLYRLYLEKLQDMVQAFALPSSVKAELLFRLTKNDVERARFFWECFRWEEIESYIEKGDKDAE